MLLAVLFYSSCFLKIAVCISKHPLLLVVSFDALGAEFLSRVTTPHLFAFSRNGVRTKYMRGVFPTKTYTNHFSMVTGTYAEDHGVLGNKLFYNNQCHTYSEELFRYNKEIVPIWTLNELAGDGRHSGSMMWHGGDFAYQEVKPTYVQKYDRNIPLTQRVDTAISWFLNTTAPANFVTMYFGNLDRMGHQKGTNSPLFRLELDRCDETAKYILDQLEVNQLSDRINVIFLSDHGMVSVKRDHLIDLNKFADLTQFTLCGSSPVLQLAVNAALDSEVKKTLIKKTYSDLKSGAESDGHFTIYLKDEIPEKYHYKHNSRVSDMLVVADIDYAFEEDMLTYFIKESKQTKICSKVLHENSIIEAEMIPSFCLLEYGVHGYDNDEPSMHSFFTAAGPGFKRKTVVAPFDNVDLYPLFARLLKLPLPAPTPKFQIRGNFDHVKAMLAVQP